MRIDAATGASAELTGSFKGIFSGSYIGDIQADSVEWDNITSKPEDIVSSSIQLATEISGSFLSTSASFEARITANSGSAWTAITGKPQDIVSSSAQINELIDATVSFGIPSTQISASIISGSHVGDGSGLTGVSADGTISSSIQIASDISGSFTLTSASLAGRIHTIEGKTLVSSSNQLASDISGSFTSTSASIAARFGTVIPAGTVSGSAQTVANLVNQTVNLGSGDFTASSAEFQNIVVNATASISKLISVETGIVKIGDSRILLNASTPTVRYAGIEVYDSGSSFKSSSFLWDGESHDWKYDYNITGEDHESAVFLAGPESTLETTRYPVDNEVQKGTNTHHLTGSNIYSVGGQVGVNKTSPINTLDIDGGTNITGSLGVSGDGNFANVYATTKIGLDSDDYIQWSGNTHLNFYVGGNNEMRLESDGDLHIDGDITAFSTTIASDKNLKDNIENYQNATDIINQINGVSFNWKKNGKASGGVIAQEVQKVLPALVNKVQNLNDNESHLTVEYTGLIGVLVEAVKSLSARVEELEKSS